MIKPGHQRLLAKINTRLTQKGLEQVAVKNVRDLDDIKETWNDLHSSALDKIDSGPVIALVYQGLDAVNEARISLGDINVKDAFFRCERQGSAEQEIALWFGEEDMATAQPAQESESKERQSTVKGWHDLFIKCPQIADHIFSQMNLEEILQLTEVCEDWGQAVQNSKMVQDRLSDVKLHKAAVEGWLRVAKILLDRGADPNQRIVCDGPCAMLSPHRCHYRYTTYLRLSWTPLHGAVFMANKEMTQLLLSKGATSEGVDSELRFYNYIEPGNPCIHTATPIQLSMMLMTSSGTIISKTIKSFNPQDRIEKRTWWEIKKDRKLVKDVLLQHSESTEHPKFPHCIHCPGFPEIIWCFRDFASHSSTKDCLVKRFNLQ